MLEAEAEILALRPVWRQGVNITATTHTSTHQHVNANIIQQCSNSSQARLSIMFKTWNNFLKSV